MKTIRAVLVFCIVVTVMMSVAPQILASGDIAYAVEGGNIYFDPYSREITDCDSSVISAIIPEEIGGIKVVSIGSYAFTSCFDLKSVSIPSSVTTIKDDAFYLSGRVKNVILSEGLVSIGARAFWGCDALKSVEIPDSVTEIGTGAFGACYALENVVISKNVNTISGSMFMDDERLTSVTIPANVTSIGNSAFWGCKSLKNVVVPSKVNSIGAYAFYKCSNLEKIVIPSSVETIGEYAFQDCDSLTRVELPVGVTQIPKVAFYSCNRLSSIVIPESVTSIGAMAFDDCNRLENVYYSGSGAAWETISIGSFNDKLVNATIHYDYYIAPNHATALVTDQKLEMNGKNINIGIYNINNKNYFKLRDIAALVNGSEKQFSVDWNGELGMVTLTTGEAYQTLDSDLQPGTGVNKETIKSTAIVVLNGEIVTLTAYNIDGYTYYQLRELCKALDIAVTWNNDTRTVGIDPSKSYA